MAPQHVAIIMDGNRRWAKQHRFEALRGHSQGTNTMKMIARHAYECGVSYLTVFAFSTENWNRPSLEVAGLIELMRRFLMQDLEALISDNVKLRIIGDLTAFDDDLVALFSEAERQTASNTGLNLTVAVNYGGQQDMLQAVQRLAKAGAPTETLEDIKGAMQTSELPNVDLVIRSGGEQRLSNFLLWDSAYAELYFSNKYWPDFTKDDFDRALADFINRDRRFGGDSVVEKASLKA